MSTSNLHASQIVNPFSQLWKVTLQKVYKFVFECDCLICNFVSKSLSFLGDMAALE